MNPHARFLALFFSYSVPWMLMHVRVCVCASLQVSLDISQRRTFILLCSFFLRSGGRGAEGWRAQTGQHRSSPRREKLGMKLKLPSKARANAVTWSSTIYTPRRWWWWRWCLHHASDKRTNTRDREWERGRREGREAGRGIERESLPSICSVPLTCHHLYCQGPSARLAPFWALINHSPAGRRKAGGRAKLCWWESIYRSGRLEERENGLVSKWLVKKKSKLQKIASKCSALECRLLGQMCPCV